MPDSSTGQLSGGTLPNGYDVILVTCYVYGQSRNVNFAHSGSTIYVINVNDSNYYGTNAIVYALKR